MTKHLNNFKKVLHKYRIYQRLAVWYRNNAKQQRFNKEAYRLVKYSKVNHTLDLLLEHQSTSYLFTSSQKLEEISRLLAFLRDLHPKVVLEIGTQKGGTLHLFSQISDPSAMIISIDYQYPSKEYMKAIPKLACDKQRIYCVQGNSHDEATLTEVKKILDHRNVDFLFIDGDHTYEGVKKDYELYSRLVRTGGIIAFHDIVEDYFTKYGMTTSNYSGGVPIFWKELKQTINNSMEVIADNNQDGFGIGLIFHDY